MTDCADKGSAAAGAVIFSSNERAVDPRLYHKVARALREVFPQVTIIGQAERGCEQGEGPLTIRVLGLQRPRSRLDALSIVPWRAFRLARAEKCALYYFSDPALLPWAWVLQRTTATPVVYDLREFQSERMREKGWIPRYLRGVSAAMYGALERLVVRRLAGAVAVNERLAAYLERCGCRAIAVVPNYPPKSLFEVPPRDAQLEERYEHKQVLVYAGVLGETRGIRAAVEAAAILRSEFPALKLLLIGRFDPESYRAETEGLVHNLGMDGHVDIIGSIPHECIPAYLAVADVGLCLLQPDVERYHWTEPVKYFEYAAAGIPEVVSDLPALRRLVERTRNGLLVGSLDPQEIARCASRLLRDVNLAREMGAAGRKAFLDRYNWEAVAEKLLALCRRVVSERRSV